jgi:hypothetical protein
MDRASGLKAGTSLKQTKKIKYPGSGSAVGFDFLLRQHMIAQNQASAKVIAKARGSK